MENHSTLPSGALSLTGYPLFVACQSGRLTGYPLAAEQIAELHHPSDLNSRYGLLLLLLKSIPAMPRLKNHPLILNLGCPRPLFADEYLHFLAANNLDIPHLILIWAGATPPAESIPPVETSLPELPGPARSIKLRPDQQDRIDCQAIARELWAEHPDWIQADLLKHPRIKSYRKQWTGKNTVPNWLSEVDPRPDDKRQGRPPKTPA